MYGKRAREAIGDVIFQNERTKVIRADLRLFGAGGCARDDGKLHMTFGGDPCKEFKDIIRMQRICVLRVDAQDMMLGEGIACKRDGKGLALRKLHCEVEKSARPKEEIKKIEADGFLDQERILRLCLDAVSERTKRARKLRKKLLCDLPEMISLDAREGSSALKNFENVRIYARRSFLLRLIFCVFIYQKQRCRCIAAVRLDIFTDCVRIRRLQTGRTDHEHAILIRKNKCLGIWRFSEQANDFTCFGKMRIQNSFFKRDAFPYHGLMLGTGAIFIYDGAVDIRSEDGEGYVFKQFLI